MEHEFNARSARSKRPLPLWADAFHRDTQDLSAEEVGAYILLLAAMWSRESCDLEDDDTRLSRICRVSPTLWKRRLGAKIKGFFESSDGVIWSKRLKKEAEFVELSVGKQSKRRKNKSEGNSLKYNNQVQSADNPQTFRGLAEDQPTQQPNNPTVKKEITNVILSSGDDDFELGDTQKEWDPVSASFDAYNDAAEKGGWPKVQVRTKARVAALRARLKEAGGIEGWCLALDKALASSHCCGKNDRGWTADFDFLTRQSSFAKLMEGNYDDRKPAKDVRANPRADALRNALHDAGTARPAQEPDWL